jgi:hypothetical protein
MQMPSMKRSQAILRMPLDLVEVLVIMHDGERSDALLFIPPTETVAHLFAEGKQFVPVCLKGREHLVARTAIACFGVPSDRAPVLTEDLPSVEQQVTIKLRSGTTLDGKLMWTSFQHERRMSDLLDNESPLVVLYGTDMVYLVAKAQIAMVSER